MIDPRDALAITGASIRTHKLRTLLATVGVILGIASVISVVTLGAGIEESIMGSIRAEFDADLVAVTLTANEQINGPPVPPDTLAFTDRDLDRIGNLTGVVATGASAPLANADVAAGTVNLTGVSVAVTRGETFSRYERGRGIAAADEAVVSNLTGVRLRKELGRDPIGVVLAIAAPKATGGIAHGNVTIVGIEKVSTFAGGQTVTVGPQFATQKPINGTTMAVWQAIVAKADDEGNVNAVKDRITAYLDRESDARHLKGDLFRFRYDTQADVARLVSQGVGQFTAFIGAIGGVALVVGLVGIANIMLVSVQERTREIGVMKATGASRGSVLAVFLTESVAICVVGAILGIGLGTGMGMALGAVVSSFSPGAPALPFVFLPQWYAIAVAMGVGVGLVAGLYPAWRAARVSPVEALRYE